MNITNQGLAIDYKYLKQICIDYFQKNKNNSFFQEQSKNELSNIYTSKYPNKNAIKDSEFLQEINNASSDEQIIKYIDNYIAQGINNDEWGRPDIEGQIICDFF